MLGPVLDAQSGGSAPSRHLLFGVQGTGKRHALLALALTQLARRSHARQNGLESFPVPPCYVPDLGVAAFDAPVGLLQSLIISYIDNMEALSDLAELIKHNQVDDGRVRQVMRKHRVLLIADQHNRLDDDTSAGSDATAAAARQALRDLMGNYGTRRGEHCVFAASANQRAIRLLIDKQDCTEKLVMQPFTAEEAAEWARHCYPQRGLDFTSVEWERLQEITGRVPLRLSDFLGSCKLTGANVQTFSEELSLETYSQLYSWCCPLESSESTPLAVGRAKLLLKLAL